MGSFALPQHLGFRRDRNVWLGLALILFVGAAAISADDEPETTSARALRAKLFGNYNKMTRPTVSHRTVTTVKLNMAMLSITELDEEKQIIELDTWLHMKWHDEYLAWNPEEYDGMTTLNIPSTEIWRPDITIYTGSPANTVPIEVLTHAIVNYTGDVLWVPPVSIHSRCPQEIETYPRDTLTCTIKIGSWTIHEYAMDIQMLDSGVKMEHFQNANPDWELLSCTAERHSKYYSCCKEPYPTIDYKVTVKRRSAGQASRRCTPPHHTSHMMQHCPFMSRMTGGD